MAGAWAPRSRGGRPRTAASKSTWAPPPSSSHSSQRRRDLSCAGFMVSPEMQVPRLALPFDCAQELPARPGRGRPGRAILRLLLLLFAKEAAQDTGQALDAVGGGVRGGCQYTAEV